MKQLVLLFAVILGLAGLSISQTSAPSPAHVRASSAYAELLLHKAELESTLESLLVDYNEEYPKVKQLRVESTLVNAEMMRLIAVKPADAGKLTLALGRLMLRKVELETELNTLRLQYKDDHPDVRKLKRKIDVFESAIREILG